MKVAVLSDVHSNLVNLTKARKIIEEANAEAVFCCGDIQTEDVLIEFKRWKIPVYIVWGNADFSLREKFSAGDLDQGHVQSFEDYGEVELSEKKIAFTHYDELARKLAGTRKYNVVFYGHTHTPWISRQEETILINPGEIAGQFGPVSLALCDLGDEIKPELKILS